MELYIVTVDWYSDEDGHNLEIIEVTDDKEKAQRHFKNYVNTHREVDLRDGYTITDDGDSYYYAHGTIPYYHRVTLQFYN